MEEKEEKGFVFKDRRKISLEDTASEGGPEGGEGAVREEEGKPKEESSRPEKDRSHMPLPELTFSTLVFSLSSSALVHLGEIAEPGMQEIEVDLPMAKQAIDTLGMLQEKTKGNLDPDEDRLLKSMLYDLRMRFLQKSGK